MCKFSTNSEVLHINSKVLDKKDLCAVETISKNPEVKPFLESNEDIINNLKTTKWKVIGEEFPKGSGQVSNHLIK